MLLIPDESCSECLLGLVILLFVILTGIVPLVSLTDDSDHRHGRKIFSSFNLTNTPLSMGILRGSNPLIAWSLAELYLTAM